MAEPKPMTDQEVRELAKKELAEIRSANKTASLISTQQHNSFMQQQLQNQQISNNLSYSKGGILTSTGKGYTGVIPDWAYLNMMQNHEVEIRKISTKVRKHNKGYYSDVAVLASDVVCWKVIKTNPVGIFLYKLGLNKKHNVKEWNTSSKYDKLEATLGAAYIAIEKEVDALIRRKDHKKFVKDILNTDPDNLKMISELKKLDGQVEDISVYSNLPSQRLSSSVRVAGQGTYYKKQIT